MRKRKITPHSNYRIIAVDDELGILESLEVVLRRNGYDFVGETDPIRAIERIKNEHFDLMILDYLMFPLHGDEVVRQIREFDREIYILLLTGHRELAPPLETIKSLAIQGYCEKSDKFDQLILLVESGIKSIDMLKTIKKFQEGLNKILLAVPKIYQLQPLGNILEEILQEIMPLVNSEDAFILVDDITEINKDEKEHRSIFRGLGKYKAEITDFMDMFNPELMANIGHARTTKQVEIVDGGVILPLHNEYLESIGVIYVEIMENELFHTTDGVSLLKIYASQAASSLSNAFMHSMVNMKNDELNRTYNELRLRYMDTIVALRLVVDAKDIYTRGHSDRVAYYARMLGEKLSLGEDDLEKLRIAGLFHDVGKIGTSDDILSKSERLSKDEYEEIKKHPLQGAHILSAVSMFKEVVPIVKCHHERVDGKGYPEGLYGDEIPYFAKIISVADAFDAMMSDRQYRSKLELGTAIEQLNGGRGTQFDTGIVDIFVGLLANFEEIQEELEVLNETILDNI